MTLRERGDGVRPGQVPHRRRPAATTGEGAAYKTVLLDAATGEPVVPERLAGLPLHRGRRGRWNLDLGERGPAAHPARATAARPSPVDLPRFDVGATEGGAVLRRGVPAARVGGHGW